MAEKKEENDEERKSEYNIQNSAIGVLAGSGCNVSLYGNVIVYHRELEKPGNEYSLPPSAKMLEGRQSVIQKLIKFYFKKEKKRLVIYGSSGCGKSEVSKWFANYCIEYKKVHRVCWIPGDSECLYEDLDVIYEMCKNLTFLLILDNVQNQQILNKFNPPENCLVLITSDIFNDPFHITSEINDWGNTEKIELKSIKLCTALQICKLLLKDTYNIKHIREYNHMLRIFNYMPLDINIFAAYLYQKIKSRDETFDIKNYISEIEQSSPHTRETYLQKAIKISLTLVLENNENIFELHVLYICLYLHANFIYFDILLEILNMIERIEKNFEVKECLKKTLKLFEKFALIIYKSNCNLIVMHNLIQNILWDHLKDNHPEIEEFCYKACMKYLFNYKHMQNDKIMTRFHVLNHFSCLKYTVYNNYLHYFITFYKEYEDRLLGKYVTSENIMENIFNMLLKWKCIKLLEVFLEKFKSRINEYIVNLNLIHWVVFHSNLYILNKLLKYDIDINTTNDANETPLHIASSNWNFDFIKILIENKAYLNIRNKNDEIPLFCFLKNMHRNKHVDSQNILQILKLYEIHNYVNYVNKDKDTLLHIVVCFCTCDLVKLLLTILNDVNMLNRQGQSPLHKLISQLKFKNDNRRRIYKTAKLLLAHRAHYHIRDHMNESPLEIAVYYNLPKFINLFFETDQSTTKEYVTKYNLLHNVIKRNNTYILQVLLQYDVEINSMNNDLDTPLHIACCAGNIRAIQHLIVHDANISIKNRSGNIPAFEYIYSLKKEMNYEECMKSLKLLTNEIPYNIANNSGENLLHIASKSCLPEVVTLLIKNGMNVNVTNKFGYTPLHSLICRKGTLDTETQLKICRTFVVLIGNGALLDVKIVNFILRNRADYLICIILADEYINFFEFCFDKFKSYASSYINELNLLMYAVFNNQLQILKLMLLKKYKANVDQIEYLYECNALHVAAYNNRLDAAKILIEHGANINSPNLEGNSPLFLFFLGVKKRQENIFLDQVREILNLFKFNPNDFINSNDKTMTILHIAVTLYCPELIDLLVKEYNVNINAVDCVGRTPLHVIVNSAKNTDKVHNVIETVKILKRHHAQVDIKNMYKDTPLKVAKELGISYLVPFLKECCFS